MALSALLSGYLGGVSGLAAFLTLPVELLYRRPAPDAWSAAEVIHNIADAEIERSVLYRRVLTETDPPVRVWDRDRYDKVLRYSDRPLLHAVGTVTALRHGNVDLFSTLSAGQWRRTAEHPELGRVTLQELVLDAIESMTERLAQARCAVNGTP